MRRIGCDADITRIITDPAGVPLDVGREHRTVTAGQWAALVVRDRGCAFPGCTRPPEWCHAHHIKHWADGGATNQDNLVLLCGHHHRVTHHGGWAITMPEDRLPEFIPPPWIHPDQTPAETPDPDTNAPTRNRVSPIGNPFAGIRSYCRHAASMKYSGVVTPHRNASLRPKRSVSSLAECVRAEGRLL